MTVETITTPIREFLSHYINVNDIYVDQDLFESGLVNSLFAMELIIFIEKEFDIQVTNDDLDQKNFKSLSAISNFVMEKRA